MMKLHVGIACAVLYCATCAHACETLSKAYVESSQVIVRSDGIFINTKEGVIKVPGIQSDEHGIYVLEEQSQQQGQNFKQRCKSCGSYFEASYPRSFCYICEGRR